jgi:DNA ligase (NAD+)
VFEPVELEGTTVSRASVHNLSIVKELELGLGDTISVYKANMIIPQIAQNKSKGKDETDEGTPRVLLGPPELCPVCGHETVVNNENGIETVHCVNEECPAKRIKSFTHFVGRNAMNIEGLSEATLEKLVDEAIIKAPVDLFRMEGCRERIVSMEGFGDKSFENLLAACDKARTVSMPKFLYSLGIPGIGLANAKLICREFGYDWEKVADASFEDLCDVSGLGEVLAGNFTRFMADVKNRAMIDDLLSEITFEAAEQTKQSAITGKTFVITGSVMHFPNRDAVKDYIESFGGKVAGSVSAKTDYLINNDTQSNSTKNKKAKELGIPIISEEDFLALAGE